MSANPAGQVHDTSTHDGCQWKWQHDGCLHKLQHDSKTNAHVNASTTAIWTPARMPARQQDRHLCKHQHDGHPRKRQHDSKTNICVNASTTARQMPAQTPAQQQDRHLCKHQHNGHPCECQHNGCLHEWVRTDASTSTMTNARTDASTGPMQHGRQLPASGMQSTQKQDWAQNAPGIIFLFQWPMSCAPLSVLTLAFFFVLYILS